MHSAPDFSQCPPAPAHISTVRSIRHYSNAGGVCSSKAKLPSTGSIEDPSFQAPRTPSSAQPEAGPSLHDSVTPRLPSAQSMMSRAWPEKRRRGRASQHIRGGRTVTSRPKQLIAATSGEPHIHSPIPCTSRHGEHWLIPAPAPSYYVIARGTRRPETPELKQF